MMDLGEMVENLCQAGGRELSDEELDVAANGSHLLSNCDGEDLKLYKHLNLAVCFLAYPKKWGRFHQLPDGGAIIYFSKDAFRETSAVVFEDFEAGWRAFTEEAWIGDDEEHQPATA